VCVDMSLKIRHNQTHQLSHATFKRKGRRWALQSALKRGNPNFRKKKKKEMKGEITE
jgi:hypothetical protein